MLDEPTNDLDIVTLQVLEEYLQNFKGCVIVVSHDRYFMDKVVDHLLVFNGQGDIRDFPGNYSDYREWKEAKAEHDKAAEKPKEEKGEICAPGYPPPHDVQGKEGVRAAGKGNSGAGGRKRRPLKMRFAAARWAWMN